MAIEPNTWIENAGFTETLYKENGKKRHNAVNWDLTYDGKKAHVDFGLDNNGKKEQVHMNLTNSDIMKLLEMNSIPVPLEKRLTSDFLKNNYIEETPTPLFISNQPTIRIRIPKKRTQKKRRKPKKKTKYTLRRFLRKLI